jgi:23S rRNA (adenine1618-N6)-methyltransferase
LVHACPELKRFITPHPCGGDTIDFADAEAVKTLNRALLKFHYGILDWNVPTGALCPAIPGRADYVHHLADLLAEEDLSAIPDGPSIGVLDIGVGASCVYPLIGNAAYGWTFVGTDIDRDSVAWARKLIAQQPSAQEFIEIRHQPDRRNIFAGVVRPSDRFHASMCNPPFHASAAHAAAATVRKTQNLGTGKANRLRRNFGGKATELWCEGGEAAFVHQMIAESARYSTHCGWFTTMISKRGNLPAIYRALASVKAVDVRTIAMGQGQKQSRIVAWTFMNSSDRLRGRIRHQAYQFSWPTKSHESTRMKSKIG